ncbi:DUF5638 domain-containing protein [Legionella drancourtii]|uniref:DUF5638 domain-containing protein n=1 Tax=Legionella drancourtii LLAP12 TaxID=658187 RepID=G9ERG9_9GAMM|nr:DUF5638 domain-containing protein [Legionella drancourtii]EHL30138.1 hypothetical protein LDG_7884 [Legionella drancourtii LLAP12]
MQGTLKKRLNHCNAQIDEIFNGFELNETFKQQIQEIKNYYYEIVVADDELIEFYEVYVASLQAVKKGEITLEDALKDIKKNAAAREYDVDIENLLQIVAMTFLFVMSTFLYLSLCPLVAPCFILHPLLGLTALILLTELFTMGMLSLTKELIEFESTLPIEAEREREIDVVSFFKPVAQSEKTMAAEKKENTDDLSCAQSF